MKLKAKCECDEQMADYKKIFIPCLVAFPFVYAFIYIFLAIF